MGPGARSGAICWPQLPQKIASLSKGVLQFGHTIIRFPPALRAAEAPEAEQLLRWQDMEYVGQ